MTAIYPESPVRRSATGRARGREEASSGEEIVVGADAVTGSSTRLRFQSGEVWAQHLPETCESLPEDPLCEPRDVDVEKANGGNAVGEDSLFKVTSGLGIGGYGVIRSERVGRYQPGNPLLSRFTAAVAPTALREPKEHTN